MKTTNLNIRLEPDLLDALRAKAKRLGIPHSELLRQLIIAACVKKTGE